MVVIVATVAAVSSVFLLVTYCLAKTLIRLSTVMTVLLTVLTLRTMMGDSDGFVVCRSHSFQRRFCLSFGRRLQNLLLLCYRDDDQVGYLSY